MVNRTSWRNATPAAESTPAVRTIATATPDVTSPIDLSSTFAEPAAEAIAPSAAQTNSYGAPLTGANGVNPFLEIAARAPTNIDWAAYVNANPDALAQWQSQTPDLAPFGADINKFGAFHYVNDGSRRNILPYNQVEQARLAAEKTKQEEAAAASAAEAKKVTDAVTARTIAQRKAEQQFAAAGLDPSQYADDINRLLDEAVSTAGPGGNPLTVIDGKAAASDILESQLRKARGDYTKEADAKFGNNYGNRIISDNLLDDTINSILNEQKGTAQDYLDRGMKRGIYNDIGYNAGQKTLSNSADVGYSKLGSLGAGVIDKYQSQADTVRDRAYGAVSGYNLGSALNLDEYANQGKAIADNASKYGKGDLLGALGGENFFDFSSLNNAAGQAQGATNLRDSDIAFALAERRKKDSTARGLGSQGAF